MRLAIYVVPLAMAIYALIELANSEPRERVGIRRWVWALMIVLLPVIGPLAWIILSRTLGGQPPATQRPQPPTGPPRTWPMRRPGPKAPDDDPEFLWRLEQEQRRQGNGGEPGADDDAPPKG